MIRDVVSIKGVADGIYVNVEGNDLNLIKVELENKIKSSSNFFKGSKFLGVRGEEL